VVDGGGGVLVSGSVSLTRNTAASRFGDLDLVVTGQTKGLLGQRRLLIAGVCHGALLCG
jgi:hypothetical protein